MGWGGLEPSRFKTAATKHLMVARLHYLLDWADQRHQERWQRGAADEENSTAPARPYSGRLGSNTLLPLLPPLLRVSPRFVLLLRAEVRSRPCWQVRRPKTLASLEGIISCHVVTLKRLKTWPCNTQLHFPARHYIMSLKDRYFTSPAT